jgi:hypothetical protein
MPDDPINPIVAGLLRPHSGTGARAGNQLV